MIELKRLGRMGKWGRRDGIRLNVSDLVVVEFHRQEVS